MSGALYHRPRWQSIRARRRLAGRLPYPRKWPRSLYGPNQWVAMSINFARWLAVAIFVLAAFPITPVVVFIMLLLNL